MILIFKDLDPLPQLVNFVSTFVHISMRLRKLFLTALSHLFPLINFHAHIYPGFRANFHQPFFKIFNLFKVFLFNFFDNARIILFQFFGRNRAQLILKKI